MSGDGVKIPLDDLERLNTSLKNIIDDFEHAGGRANDLEGWIGSPHGDSQLRSEIDRFEGAWNDKRNTLKDDLASVQERVESVGNGWADFDAEAAADLDRSIRTPQVEKPE